MKFANEIFHRSAAGQTVFWYGPWLLKFAVSLGWRAIQFRRLEGIEESPTLDSMTLDMERHLSQFLLGKEPAVGPYTQHIYPVGALASPVTPGSPFLSRYLARAVQIDFLRNDDLSEMMVYVKLPMFMFFSVGASKYRTWLETSRIKKSSVLQPKTHTLEKGVLNYIVNQSDRASEILNSMSVKSKDVADKAILAAIKEDPDRVRRSKLMEAMRADYEFYGKEAVIYQD